MSTRSQQRLGASSLVLLGIAMPLIIAPGEAARSVLVARVDRRDVDGMPPLGSTIVDADGVALLTDWVDGLANCN